MSALIEIQQALLQACRADGDLMVKVSGVFDHTPIDSSLPYIVIGEATETPLNTFEQQSLEVQSTIRIYSGEQGYSEAYDILQSLTNGLRHIDLPMQHFELVSLDYQSGAAVVEDATEEADNRQVQAIYRMIVQRV
ncbi:DUF3168 domain-containing protein [Bacillus horti]|uniref:DUF3168 domain-containing protein n=1 Tax=Caldalkalibacillus horti TaxID=77523 RepID=A0ABT9W6H4_9BACI|nr:DUF3168 domain-containing protein [Bacillus horti]MDQ0168450.1 hypothetical protein [Bacillus horti]